MHPVTQHNQHRVCAIPLFDDNYAWLIYDNTHAWIIDPGHAEPIAQATAALGVTLAGFLITHSHWDHVNGITPLAAMQAQPPKVFGPPNIHDGINHHIKEGDTLDLNGLTFEVWHTPGHMAEHLSFYCPEANWLFCGDTLFASGCGRLRQTGSMPALFSSLDRMKALPAHTLIFCAHEYTQSNLRFAETVEPHNLHIQARITAVDQQRQQGQPSLPTTLADELNCNPFLRVNEPTVAASVNASCVNASSEPLAVFSALRQWKDVF